jgi:hypothetical protein
MERVFKQIVAFADQTDRPSAPITLAEYEQWRESYTFLALQGQRYGQSFCNTFGITDNHLYYNDYNHGGIEWADDYIRKTYLARS